MWESFIWNPFPSEAFSPLPATYVCHDDLLTVRRSITLVDLQLDAQNSYLFTYNTFIKILYMFRALLCSSSGGLRRNCIYRVSQEECARLREGVPYVKVYRYNPKHLCLKLNSYGYNGQRKVWSSGGSTHCTCQLTSLIDVYPWVWCQIRKVSSH